MLLTNPPATCGTSCNTQVLFGVSQSNRVGFLIGGRYHDLTELHSGNWSPTFLKWLWINHSTKEQKSAVYVRVIMHV